MAGGGFKGLDAHKRRLAKLTTEARKVAGSVVFETSDAIRREAFISISRGSSSGKSGGKHQHVPSRPGEPPNRFEGDLQAGLENIQTGPLSAEVRAKAGHSAPLEFGTSRMAARPFMRPARDKETPKAEKRMAEQMSILVKRSG